MTEATTRPPTTRRQRKATAWIDELLVRLNTLQARKDAENRRYKEAEALLKKQRNEALDGVDEEIADIHRELAQLVRGRLYWMLRWFSKTIHRPEGVITFVNGPAQLEVPANVDPVIDALEKLPGGEAYLRVVKELDRKALGEAPDEVLDKLRRLGVRRVPHDLIRVKTPFDTKAVEIARWVAKPRTRRATPRQS